MQAAFIENPFGFTKKLLGQKSDGNLVCSNEELELHLQNTYPSREPSGVPYTVYGCSTISGRS